MKKIKLSEQDKLGIAHWLGLGWRGCEWRPDVCPFKLRPNVDRCKTCAKVFPRVKLDKKLGISVRHCPCYLYNESTVKKRAWALLKGEYS